MNRSTKILVAGSLLAGLAALPIANAAASEGPKRVHLVLTESTTSFHFIDAPAADEDGQAGDTITFESDLASGGSTVGSLAGHCIQLHADGTLDDCEVTVTVGKSSFRMAGPFDPAAGGTLTVLGGTNRWLGVGGTDTIANQPDGTAIHTIDLVRP